MAIVTLDQLKSGNYQTQTIPQTNKGFLTLDELKSGVKSEPGIFQPTQQPATLQAPQQSGGFTGFLKGVGKGAADTIINTGTMAAKGLNTITGQSAKNASLEQTKTQFNDFNKPQGLAENIGYGSEKVGEFFLPGAQEKLAIGAVDEAVNGLKLVEQFGPKGAEIVKGLLKVAGTAGVTGSSAAGVTALQTGGDIQEIKSSAIVSAAGGTLAKSLELLAPGIIKSVTKSNFKLSPSAEAKMGAKATNAANFVADNGLTSANLKKQFSNLETVNSKLESTLQSSLKSSESLGGNPITVSKQELIANINKVPEVFKDKPAIYKQVQSQVKEAIGVINETQGDAINLNTLLEGKRSFGQSAFGKSKAALKGNYVVSEGDFALEQAYQKTLEDGLNMNKGSIKVPNDLQKFFGGKTDVTLQEFNKVYSNAITAKQITNLAQFKKDTGLVGRFFGLWAGEAVGQAIAPGLGGKLVGATIGEMAAGKGKQIMTGAAIKATKNAGKIIPATKAVLGAKATNKANNP